MKYESLPENLKQYILNSNYFGIRKNGDIYDDRDDHPVNDVSDILDQIAWDAECKRESNTDFGILNIADHVSPEMKKFLMENSKITSINGQYFYEDGNPLSQEDVETLMKYPEAFE